ncbi:hypothetical protein HYU06_01965 [Candidatus Woesearchaeota archaeon]|nr:hypothetical protein [Candidatus Woesearchaeota archaeon]
MRIESHLENLKESAKEINDAITEGLLSKQRSIGFHASAGAIDMVEILLHENNLIDTGFVIKHEWFKSEKSIENKFHFDFPNKKEILILVKDIETIRNKLCYGKRQSEETLEKVINDFNKLKEIFSKVSKHEL